MPVMKRSTRFVVAVVSLSAFVVLAQSGIIAKSMPRTMFFHLDDEEHTARIKRQAVLSSPTWDPSKPLPLGMARAEAIARKELMKLVTNESAWEAQSFELDKIRGTAHWYYVVHFMEITPHRGYTPTNFPDSVDVLVDLSGRPGVFDSHDAQESFR